jgi:predicted Rossmann fold flavoprotein
MVSGVRADAQIVVMNSHGEVTRERGELQLTDYGISGIPVFQISRVMNYMLCEQKQVEVHIDLLPDYDEKEFLQLMQVREKLFKDGTAEKYFTGMLNKKIMLLFMKIAGIKPTDNMEHISEEKLKKVYGLCKDWRVTVTGSNPYNNAQVCAGGVPLCEVDGDMQSLKVPGLFFAGELLDVDGKCGGYNLHFAFACARVIAEELNAKFGVDRGQV